MDLLRIVAEEDEGWRRDVGLGGVIELEPLAGSARRRMFGDGVLNQLVQRAGRDATLPFLDYQECGLEYLLDPLPELGGDEDERDVGHKIERFLSARSILV